MNIDYTTQVDSVLPKLVKAYDDSKSLFDAYFANFKIDKDAENNIVKHGLEAYVKSKIVKFLSNYSANIKNIVNKAFNNSGIDKLYMVKPKLKINTNDTFNAGKAATIMILPVDKVQKIAAKIANDVNYYANDDTDELTTIKGGYPIGIKQNIIDKYKTTSLYELMHYDTGYSYDPAAKEATKTKDKNPFINRPLEFTEITPSNAIIELLRINLIRKISYEDLISKTGLASNIISTFSTFKANFDKMSNIAINLSNVTAADETKLKKLYVYLTVLSAKVPYTVMKVTNLIEKQQLTEAEEKEFFEQYKSEDESITKDSYANLFKHESNSDLITQQYYYTPELQKTLLSYKLVLLGKKEKSASKNETFTFNQNRVKDYNAVISQLKQLIANIRKDRPKHSIKFSSLMKRLDRINNFALTGRFFGSNNSMFN